MTPEPLKVDTDALRTAGNGLLNAAKDIPGPPEPFTVSGTDPLAAGIKELETPLIEGLPALKADATETAEKVIQAADRYDNTDQQLQDKINKRTFPHLDRDGQHGKVRMVDDKFRKDAPPPSLPDPVTKLGLPNYNPGSLDGRETRIVYTQAELRMRQLNDQLARQGVSAEERARQMCDLRNSVRTWGRDIMQNRADAALLAARDPNRTFDELVALQHARGLRGDAVYDAIIESSTRSRPEVNAAFGIDPEHPPPLPPVNPSNPVWEPSWPPGQPPVPSVLPPMLGGGGSFDPPMMGGGGRFGEGGPSTPVTQPPPPPEGEPPMMGGGGRF